MSEPPVSTKWFGFHSWVELLKATATMGSLLVVGLGAVFTYAVDEMQRKNDQRYVLRDDLSTALEEIAGRVETVGNAIERIAHDRDCKNVVGELVRLEDTIEYKRLIQADHGLEDKLLERARREFRQLGECQRVVR